MSANTCPNCRSTSISYDQSAGNYSCSACGTVVNDFHMTSELGFNETGTGGASVVGQFVARDGRTVSGSGVQTGLVRREAREITTAKAKKSIASTIAALVQNTGISPATPLITVASQIFTTALVEGHVRGRRSEHVYAACIYIAAVRGLEPYLLIDLAQATECNVYEIGECATQMSKRLSLKLTPNDPSSYVHRFALRLNLGEHTHRVARDAIKLVQLMKRDWIAIGRRVNGLCAAALLLSARAHGFTPELDDLGHIFKVSTQTIKSRLADISNSSYSKLTFLDLRMHFGTPEEIMEAKTTVVVNEDGIETTFFNDTEPQPLLYAADPPSFQRGMIQRTRITQWRDLLLEKHDLAILLLHQTTLFDLSVKSNVDPIQSAINLSSHDFSKLLDQVYTQLRSIDQWCKNTETTRADITTFFTLYDLAAKNTVDNAALRIRGRNKGKSTLLQSLQNSSSDLAQIDDDDGDGDENDDILTDDEDISDIKTTRSTRGKRGSVQRGTKSNTKASKNSKTSKPTSTSSHSAHNQSPLKSRQNVVRVVNQLLTQHDNDYTEWVDWLRDKLNEEFEASQGALEQQFYQKNPHWAPIAPLGVRDRLLEPSLIQTKSETDQQGQDNPSSMTDGKSQPTAASGDDIEDDDDDIFGIGSRPTRSNPHPIKPGSVKTPVKAELSNDGDDDDDLFSEDLFSDTDGDKAKTNPQNGETPATQVQPVQRMEDSDEYKKYLATCTKNEENHLKVLESLNNYYNSLIFSKNLFLLTDLNPRFKRVILDSVSDDHDVDNYDIFMQKVFNEEFFARYAHLSGIPAPSSSNSDLIELPTPIEQILPNGFPEPTLADFILFQSNRFILKPLLECAAYGYDPETDLQYTPDGFPLSNYRAEITRSRKSFKTAAKPKKNAKRDDVHHNEDNQNNQDNDDDDDDDEMSDFLRKKANKGKKLSSKQLWTAKSSTSITKTDHGNDDDNDTNDSDDKPSTAKKPSTRPKRGAGKKASTSSDNSLDLDDKGGEDDESYTEEEGDDVKAVKSKKPLKKPSSTALVPLELLDQALDTTTSGELGEADVEDDKDHARVLAVLNHLHFTFLFQYQAQLNLYRASRYPVSSTTTPFTAFVQPVEQSVCFDAMCMLEHVNPADLIDAGVINAVLDALTTKTRSLLSYLTQQEAQVRSVAGGGKPSTLIPLPPITTTTTTTTSATTTEAVALLPNKTHTKSPSSTSTDNTLNTSTALVELDTTSLISATSPVSPYSTALTQSGSSSSSSKLFLPLPRLHEIVDLNQTFSALQPEFEATRELEFTTLVQTAVADISDWLAEKSVVKTPRQFYDDLDDSALDELLLNEQEQEQREFVWEQVVQRIHGVSRQHKEQSADSGEGRKRARQLRMAEEEQKKTIDFATLRDDDVESHYSDARGGISGYDGDDSLFSDDYTDHFSFLSQPKNKPRSATTPFGDSLLPTPTITGDGALSVDDHSPSQTHFHTTDNDSDDDEDHGLNIFSRSASKRNPWDPIAAVVGSGNSGKESLQELNALFNTIDPGNTNTKAKAPRSSPLHDHNISLPLPTGLNDEDASIFSETDHFVKRQRGSAAPKPPARRR